MQVARSRPLFFSPSPSLSHSVSPGLTFQSCFRQALIVIDDSPLISILVGFFSKVRQSHQASIELGPSNLNQARILKSLARPVRASQPVSQSGSQKPALEESFNLSSLVSRSAPSFARPPTGTYEFWQFRVFLLSLFAPQAWQTSSRCSGASLCAHRLESQLLWAPSGADVTEQRQRD